MGRRLTPHEEVLLVALERRNGEALFVQLADDLDCSEGEVRRLALSLHERGRVFADTVSRRVWRVAGGGERGDTGGDR